MSEESPNTNHAAKNLAANARIFKSKNADVGHPVVN